MARGESYAVRLNAAEAAEVTGPLSFFEHGHEQAVDPFLFGDVVLARKDMPASYHLAVVVDDAFQDVSLVTRGEDLLPSAHAQRVLQNLLGLPAPAYAHHRLITGKDGRQILQTRSLDDAPQLERRRRHAGRGRGAVLSPARSRAKARS